MSNGEVLQAHVAADPGSGGTYASAGGGRDDDDNDDAGQVAAAAGADLFAPTGRLMVRGAQGSGTWG